MSGFTDFNIVWDYLTSDARLITLLNTNLNNVLMQAPNLRFGVHEITENVF